MSYKSEYAQFFTSPAGQDFLTWLQEQRTSNHEKAEDNVTNAQQYAIAAKVYREVIEHIDSVQVGMGRSSATGDLSSVSPVVG